MLTRMILQIIATLSCRHLRGPATRKAV
jgi:hypothetical protein